MSIFQPKIRGAIGRGFGIVAAAPQMQFILRLDAVARLNFYMGFVHISGVQYSRAADDLLAGRLHLDIDPGLKKGDVQARYYRGARTFEVPDSKFGENLDGAQAVVHEITHHIIHTNYWNLVPNSLNEACAYVAAGAFMVNYTGEPNPDFPFLEDTTILKWHYKIGNFVAKNPGSFVPAEDEWKLRKAILLDPHYAKKG